MLLSYASFFDDDNFYSHMSKTEEILFIDSFPPENRSGSKLQELQISGFRNSAGTLQDIVVSFQSFGPAIGNAPVVLVNHALTGNSLVTGKKGWWKELVGPDKVINTNRYTVLAIDMPGNGSTEKNHHLIQNYKEFTLQDYAKIYVQVLEMLGINRLFAAIGGSIGGALAWELAVLQPDLIEHLIPVATDYKATDWVLAHCRVQEQILNNSVTPVHDARMHAMTFYRTPQSLRSKFNLRTHGCNGEHGVCDWLSHHGRALEGRFRLASYKLMNHLLTTVDISRGTGNYLEAAAKINAHIHIITIDSDWFFLAEENWEAYVDLSCSKAAISIHEVKSIHGHDAFLIEHRQVANFLKPIFNSQISQNEKDQPRALRSR